MEKKLNLICLTFAGGNKYSFRQLFEDEHSFYNVIVVEYPGRGSRIREALISDMHQLVDDLYHKVKFIVDKGDYAIYGHSLGGLVSYLLVLKLLENHHKAPEHVIISGTTGPSSLSRTEKKRHLLPHDAFISEIKSLGGMPEEILQNEDLLNFVEPILRNDFSVSEKYTYEEHRPLNVQLTVITGTEEDMEIADIALWQRESLLPVNFIQLPGGHFFIFPERKRLLHIIEQNLTGYTNSAHSKNR